METQANGSSGTTPQELTLKPEAEVVSAEAVSKETAVDWVKIREDYVSGEERLSQIELAKKHNVSCDTLRKQSANGKWSVLREQYWKEVSEELRRQQKKKAVEYRKLHITTVGNAIVKIAKDIQKGSFKWSPRDLDALIRLQADLLGEPVGKTQEHQQRVILEWANDGENAVSDS